MEDKRYLTFALGKGRLANQTLELFEKIGITCEEIYDKKMSAAQFPINSFDVFIVDDLYQSGTTMWAFARYLKNLGARQVFGLACVKSLRDSDNVGDWV